MTGGGDTGKTAGWALEDVRSPTPFLRAQVSCRLAQVAAVIGPASSPSTAARPHRRHRRLAFQLGEQVALVGVHPQSKGSAAANSTRRCQPDTPPRPNFVLQFDPAKLPRGRTARLPWHGGHGRRRRRRGDGCRSRATWASGQAGHPERRCLSPRPWRPNVPLVGGELNGAGGGGRGAAGRARRGRGGVTSWPRRRGESPTVKPAAAADRVVVAAPACPSRDDLQADGLGQSRARRPASRRGSRARRDRRSRRYAERRVGGHGPDCGGSP